MSLRAFHIVFVALSAALAVFFAAWASGQYRFEGGMGYMATIGVSLGAAFGLAAYGVSFIRRTRNL